MAEKTDQSRQNASRRLNELVEEGYLERREVGARAVVYWITEAGVRYAANSDAESASQ